jgi:hypothetical protein
LETRAAALVAVYRPQIAILIERRWLISGRDVGGQEDVNLVAPTAITWTAGLSHIDPNWKRVLPRW